METELVRIRKEGDAAWRSRRRKNIVVGVFVGLVILCSVTGIILAILDDREGSGARSGTDSGIASADTILRFDCPAEWLPITATDVDELLATSLEGLEADALTHVGGCYLKGVGDCAGCAQIVSLVVLEPDMPGTLTDEQYYSVEAATRRQMGSRLESFHGVVISGMPGVESIHIGKSGRTKLQDLIIVPPEPGILYMLSASTDLESWSELQPVFEQAVASLRIVGQPVTVPVSTAASESTPREESTLASVPTLEQESPGTPAPGTPAPATQAAVAAVAGTAEVVSEALNVRSGPGTAFEPVAGLVKGDSAEVLARSAESGWLYVRCADGTLGWISGKHVELSVPLEVVPVAADAPAP